MTTKERGWILEGIDQSAYEALARSLPPSRLWSLLMEILAARATERNAPSLLRQWQTDGFTRPSAVDQRTLLGAATAVLEAARAFEAIELSPLAPLGSCSAVAHASQNKIVSALRGTEVVSDPTNVLALECAERLRNDPSTVVRLATCHRVLRAQQLPDRPGFTRHFQIFCLATAGRERAGHTFTADALIEQIATHLAALDRLEALGYSFRNRRLRVLAVASKKSIADRVADAVHHVPVSRHELEHAYYSDGLRFMIDAENAAGDDVPLIDGGAFDWVRSLSSNHRLAFVASGMGLELSSKLFKR